MIAVSLLAVAAVMPLAGEALVIETPMKDPQAIVVLTSHEWERLPAAARLAAQCPSCPVVLTRPAVVTRYNCRDCGRRPDQLVAMSVDRHRIVVLSQPTRNTYDEAMVVRDFVRRLGVRRLTVVTSPYHTRRSLMTFQHVLEREGIRVNVAAGFPESIAKPAQWWLHPYDRWYVAHEWLAILLYRVKYGVPMTTS